MVLLTAFTPSGVVLAEEVEILWEYVEKEITGKNQWCGEFESIKDTNIKIYVPTKLEEMKLTDEDKKDGYVTSYSMGEEAEFDIRVLNAEGYTIETFDDYLKSKGINTSTTPFVVNGLDAVLYYADKDFKEFAVSIINEDGNIVEFSYYPDTDEDVAKIGEIMMCSIQAE